MVSQSCEINFCYKISFTAKHSLTLSGLLTATSEPKQAYISSAKKSSGRTRSFNTHVVDICAQICAVLLCFCGVFLLGPEGFS